MISMPVKIALRMSSNMNKAPTILPLISNYRSDRRLSTNVNVMPSIDTVAKYGGRFTTTMISGDGIGPEMMSYVKQVFKYAGAPVDFQEVSLDGHHTTDADFHNALIAIKRNGVAIKGNIESYYGTGGTSRNAALRVDLDLFVNVVRCKTYPGVTTRHDNIDIVIIRQNTGGEYAMLEHESVPGVVESLKIMTTTGIERLARFGFEHAQRHRRKKVTCIHKANIMKLADGLFLETCKRVAKDYPGIEFDSMIVDNTCMQLVSRPDQFDVMICPNLYGTVLTNIVCGLIGGAGLVSGSNYGVDYAVFEPGTRNTGAAITGKNVANPAAMLHASCDMLEHLKLTSHSKLIRHAVNATVNDDLIHTPDLGGQASSLDFVQNVLKYIKRDAAKW